jgi:hypothetical protein
MEVEVILKNLAFDSKITLIFAKNNERKVKFRGFCGHTKTAQFMNKGSVDVIYQQYKLEVNVINEIKLGWK